MSKRKLLFSPSQMIILSGLSINEGQTGGGFQFAKPDPFEDEEEDIILPDGETMIIEENDIILPSAEDSGYTFDEDAAYY